MMLSKTLLLWAAATAAMAQPFSFEVASVKAAPGRVPGVPMRINISGGPETDDPGRWSCENVSLANIVSDAYDLRAFELVAPDWMQEARFTIAAKMPVRTTQAQFREMLQTLLAERFGLKVHREKKEMSGFELVLAKNGPKFKPAAPPKSKDPDDDARARRDPGPPPRDANGFPVMPPGESGMAIMGGYARAQFPGTTMEEFARTLSHQANRPVSDATGLAGKYDVSIYWLARRGPVAAPGAEGNPASAASEPAGPTLFAALQEQLGLKLESKKVTMEVTVVDHAEKTPTEN